MFENSSEELASNKLLILYILDKVKMDLTNSQITQFIMETELMNYFSLQEFLSQLIESNFVQIFSESNKEFYCLTNKGIQALEYFLGRIPQDIKDKIDVYTVKNKDQILNDTQVKSDFIKVSDNEFIVSLKVIENQTNLIDLNLNVSSDKQAKLICDNWKNNASHLYSDIIQLLISAE